MRQAWRCGWWALLGGFLAGGCVEETVPGPVITGIEPRVVPTGVETAAVISGRRFYAEARSRLDADRAPNLDVDFRVLFVRDATSVPAEAAFVDTETLTVTVPATLASGLHDVVVVTPAGRRATLPEGLRAVGSPTHIVLEDAPGGGGAAITDLELTCDDELTFYAVSRDAEGEFVADAVVEWTLVGNPVGILGTEPGSESMLELTRPGFGAVEATHATLGTARAVLDVVAGVPARVVVTGQPGGDVLSGVNLSVGTAVLLYASGYDADSNYLGELPASWILDQPIGTFAPAGATPSVTLTATTVGVGRVTGTPASGAPGSSGPIRVISGAATEVWISAAESAAQPLATVAMTADEERTVYAVAVDSGGNFVASAEVSWAWVEPGCPFAPPPAAPAVSLRLTGGAAGVCTLSVDHDTLTDTVTAEVTVGAGALARLALVDGLGDPLAEQTLTAGESLTAHAVGFDADDNPRGAVEVSWSLSAPLGTLTETQRDQTTLQATTTGQGRIIAEVVAGGAQLTAQSPLVTVVAGEAVTVSIEDQPAGVGQPIVSLTVAVSSDTLLYAVARDGFGNARADGCEAVEWGGSLPGGTGYVGGTTGCSVTLRAGNSTGSGNVVINEDTLNGSPDDDVTLTVSDASIAALYVSTDPTACATWGGGVLTTDATTLLYAVACDASNNRVSNPSVAWTVSGGIGALTPPTGSSTTFNPTTPGTGQVVASHGTYGTATSGTVTVVPGALHRVVIVTSAGAEVGSVPLTAGELRTWFSVGEDADGNRLGPRAATWSVQGGVGSIAPAAGGESAVFTATTVTPTPGSVRAARADAQSDSTGPITVSAGLLAEVRIEDAAGGGGERVTTVKLNADQSRWLYAVGRDSYGNFVSNQSSSWSVTGGVGVVSPASGSGTQFFADKTGFGTIVASGGGFSATVDPVEVTPGALSGIYIERTPRDPFDEIDRLTLVLEQQVPMAAVGRDADLNYREEVSVYWAVTGWIGSVAPVGPATETVFRATAAGTGTVQARLTAGGTPVDATGEISVEDQDLCGNGQIDPGEVCDGGDLDGHTCLSRGHLLAQGGLSCASDCKSFVTIGCGSKIETVTRINEAIAQAYGTEQHVTVAIQQGSYTLGAPLVLDECANNCTLPHAGIILTSLAGGVVFKANCGAAAEFYLIEVKTPRNEVRDLRLETCGRAIRVLPGADFAVLSRNLITQVSSAPTAVLVSFEAEHGLVEANRIVVPAGKSVAHAFWVGGQGSDYSARSGNRLVMNVVSGEMQAAIRVLYAGAVPPLILDHNSLEIRPGMMVSASTGLDLDYVAGLCARNNIVVNRGISMSAVALDLQNVTLADCGGAAEPNAGRNVARVAGSNRCAGASCTLLCPPIGGPLCDLDYDPGWDDSGRLCLAESGDGLVDYGHKLGWDMVDDSPPVKLFIDDGPEVGARERYGVRYFAKEPDICD